MKKLMGSLVAKITAIILSFLMVCVLAVSAVSVVLMVNFDFYTKDIQSAKNAVISEFAENEIYNIYELYDGQSVNLTDYYKDKNILFSVSESKTGEVLATNYNGEKYLVEKESNGMTGFEKYITEDEDGNYSEKEGAPYTIDIKVYIPQEMKNTDKFSVSVQLVDFFYPLRFSVIVFGVLSALLSVVLLSFLYCAEGHRKDGSVQLNHLDRIPFDFLTAAVIAAAFLSIYAVEANYGYWLIIVLPIVLSFDYFIGLAYTLSFAARIKTKTLLKNNIIYKVLAFLGKNIKKLFKTLGYVFSNLTLVKKTALITAITAFVEFFLLIAFMNVPEALLFFWIIFTAVICTAILFITVTLQKIKTGGERIASGDLEYKIKTEYMYGDFKEFSESLNNISTGLQNAVNEKMKSERFKTELITNVSHDIKTPLTSIINYVDLIKKEKPENENMQQYIEVLDRQSGRLKKLIEDLVEASKASTGNLAVSLAECEVGVLLSQTIGEFDERLQKANLHPVLKQPEKPVRIMADGRHLWRVFDNLMSNVCKYSQNGTRVYMDVFEENGKAVITFRNISGYELNISSEELMERFVRGDTSRNTEGSGLGLSIARSLVELQNGTMQIEVDGDLFKVIIKFEVIK